MKLSDLIPAQELQALCESFSTLTGAVTAVLDLEGNVLVATGWQDICTRFHRVNPATAKGCWESDTVLAGQLSQGKPYNVYKCKNGLVDVAVPIVIGGQHVGNFFTGQFFFEEPDREYFIHQAEDHGFNTVRYLDALSKIPVFSEYQVRTMMEFFTRLARLIGDMGLARANQEKANLELNESKHLLQSIIDTIPIRVFWKDQSSHYLGCNPVFANDAGKKNPDDVIGQDDYHLTWADRAHLYRDDDQSVIESGQSKLFYEEQIRRSDGQTAWVRTSKVPLRNQKGEIIGVLGVYDDITDRKDAENQIRELAYFDHLTGLPNRRLLKDRLTQALISSVRNDSEGALLFVDLDNFKIVNDTQGHDTGDCLLQEVAARFRTTIRDVDTVSRVGGDEFVVVLIDLNQNPQKAAAQARLFGERLLTILGEPYQIGGKDFRCTPSIGITMFGEKRDSIDELMKQADIAMYKAKASGRNTLMFFDPELQSIIRVRADLESDLREGLDKQQFLLFYQPQVVENGVLTGAEALVRWQHPQRGMVSPADFIPLAEDTGVILPLGEWVLETACTQLAKWAQHPELAHLAIAVNVSARQFHQSDFVDRVMDVINRTGAHPKQLKLELTESLLIDNMEEIINKMHLLKDKGVEFSLDDFGTGYSSLAYLKRLPLNQLKIDQSFVRDILTDSNDATVAKTIVALAKSFGLEVIAEGVETVEQRDFLLNTGCRAFQGYFFSRPLPVENFEQLIIKKSYAGESID